MCTLVLSSSLSEPCKKKFCFQGSDRRILEPERIYSDSVKVVTSHQTAVRGCLHTAEEEQDERSKICLWQQTDFYNVRKSCCLSVFGFRLFWLFDSVAALPVFCLQYLSLTAHVRCKGQISRQNFHSPAPRPKTLKPVLTWSSSSPSNTPQRWWGTAKMSCVYIHLFIASIKTFRFLWIPDVFQQSPLLPCCWISPSLSRSGKAESLAGALSHQPSISIFTSLNPLLQSHKYGRVKVKIFSIFPPTGDGNVTRSL